MSVLTSMMNMMSRSLSLGAFLRLALVPLQLGVVLMASLALALLVRILPRPQVFVVDTITQRIIVTQEHRNEGSTTIAYFFHPDCASGGGGERVLWAAILGLLRANKEGTIVIYTDEKSSVNRVSTTGGHAPYQCSLFLHGKIRSRGNSKST